jgi:hypothetical protein
MKVHSDCGTACYLIVLLYEDCGGCTLYDCELSIALTTNIECRHPRKARLMGLPYYHGFPRPLCVRYQVCGLGALRVRSFVACAETLEA